MQEELKGTGMEKSKGRCPRTDKYRAQSRRVYIAQRPYKTGHILDESTTEQVLVI